MCKTWIASICVLLLIGCSSSKKATSSQTTGPIGGTKGSSYYDISKSSEPISEEPAQSYTEYKEEPVRRYTPPTSNNTPSSDFRIQLGVFNNLNAQPNFGGIPNINTHISNNKKVFDITGFQTPHEAFVEAQRLKSMNIKGAFVTKYVNGARDYSFTYDEGITSSRSDIPNSMKSRAISKPASNPQSKPLDPPSKAASSPVYNNKGIIEVAEPKPRTSPSKLVILEEE